MGSKKVKAIVVDADKMPPFHDRKKLMGAVREYGKLLKAEPAIEAFTLYGTAMVADLTNKVGGLPTRNFSAGTLVDTAEETMKLGGTWAAPSSASRPSRAAASRPTPACRAA
jgi:aldehyde:ferredoxin oxidoreductase